MTLNEFLQYAMGPGVAAVVAVILSIIVEYIPSYDALAPKYKRLVFVALSLTTPVLALVIGLALGELDYSRALLFDALVAGFVASGIGTLAHTRKL